MSARFLMIGLDGADGHVLDRCSADGTLPDLANLRSEGRAKRLSALPGLSDDALWASFQYAADIGEHGRFHYYFAEPEARAGKAYWEEEDQLTFWDRLSASGMRVAVLDVPKCRNPRPINGIHLADWLVHGRYFPKPRSQPHSLAAEIVETFGEAPPSRCDYWQHALSDREVSEIRSNLHQGTQMKSAAGVHYLGAEDWDLFIICFKAAHCANHVFLDFEPSHPAHDPNRRARLGDPIMSVLFDIDRAVGNLVAAAGPASEVLVFSPSDFQPNGTLDHFLPAIVDRMNERLLSKGDRMAELFKQGGEGGPPSPSEFQCLALPYNENCAALRITRREPWSGNGSRAGIPDPGVLDVLEELLWTLRDSETGQQVISAVTRPSTELEGSRATSLPDLLVHWASGHFPRAILSQALGRFEGKCPAWRPGNHAAGGFAIAAGDRLPEALEKVESLADLGSLPGSILS